MMMSSRVALALVLALATVANAEDLLVFGDSWGTGARTQVVAMAAANNKTVANAAVGGTTAAYWAARPTSLRDAVASSGASHVWLTIGGNDVIPSMIARTPWDQIRDKAINDTKAFLDPLYAAFPNVRVAQTAYDVLAWTRSLTCQLFGATIYWECSGTGDIRCVNDLTMLIHNEYSQALQDHYGAPRFTAVSVAGALQTGGGVPDAEYGKPNLDAYSPSNLVSADCIHCSSQGYTYVMDALYELYFRSEWA